MGARMYRREEMIKKRKNYILISSMVFIIVLRIFILFIVKISSEFMTPALNIGDRLIAMKVYNTERLERGDIVIFYSREEEQSMIKRLIGLPGDMVSIQDGYVNINDEKINEPYIYDRDNFNGRYRIPNGEYFFLGDNRLNSYDSRM